MTILLSFPLRLNPDGSFATRDDSDDDYYAEELAQLIGTIPGERVLVPTYGMEDPTFDQFNQAALMAQVETFGPPVTIASVDSSFLDATHSAITVEFDTSDDDSVDDDYGDS